MARKKKRRKKKRTQLTKEGALCVFQQKSNDYLVDLLLEGKEDDVSKAVRRAHQSGRAKLKGRLPE
jgi:hypothetical protein